MVGGKLPVNNERYNELNTKGFGLTEDEFNQGWHWCYDWDMMLVGPTMEEALFCNCNKKIQEWKQTEDAKKVEEEMNIRIGKLDADAFNQLFRTTDGE